MVLILLTPTMLQLLLSSQVIRKSISFYSILESILTPLLSSQDKKNNAVSNREHAAVMVVISLQEVVHGFLHYFSWCYQFRNDTIFCGFYRCVNAGDSLSNLI